MTWNFKHWALCLFVEYTPQWKEKVEMWNINFSLYIHYCKIEHFPSLQFRVRFLFYLLHLNEKKSSKDKNSLHWMPSFIKILKNALMLMHCYSEHFYLKYIHAAEKCVFICIFPNHFNKEKVNVRDKATLFFFPFGFIFKS